MHVVVACLLSVAVAASAQPLTTAVRTDGAITLDGTLDESAWNGAIAASDFRILETDDVPARPSTFRLLYDSEALYLGLKCPWPAGSLQALPEPRATSHDAGAYGDEALEFYLRPKPDEQYWHLVFNVAGVRYDARGMDKAVNPDWQVATQSGPEGWSAEARIPFASLGLSEPPADGARWTMNAARNDRLNRQYSTWSHLQRGFHEPGNFGTLVFREDCPGVEIGAPYRADTDIVWTMTAHGGQADRLEANAAIRTPAGEAPLQSDFTGDPPTARLVAEGFWQAHASVWRRAEITFGDAIVYSSQPLVCDADSLRPPRPDKPLPVRLANDSIALTFDRNTGRLLKIDNREADLTISFEPEGAPIAELETARFLTNPRFFEDEDVKTIVPDFETLRDVTTSESDGGDRITFRHRIGHAIDLTLTVTVPPSGCETRWDIAIDNRLSTRPSKSLVVHRVRYPHIASLPEDACGSEPYAVVPSTMGERIPEPSQNLGQNSRYPYIGPTTMGWFDYYGADGGLYFKVGETGRMPQTDLILRGNPQTSSVDLGIERWALCWPGDRWAPGPCGVAPHAGDWHSAADLYREWFRDTFTLRETPDWLREAQGYVMSGSSGYEFGQLPRALEHAKAIGINYIELWSEMAGGDISYHAYGFPNPYMGTEDDLREAVRELHASGGHLGVYLNFNTGDPLLGTFVRQPRLDQKIPEDEPRPALDYMEDNWVQQSLMNHTGSYSMWSSTVPGYLDDYWNQCPAADKWTDLYRHWVVDKWAKDYGIDVWYLDSCPVSRGSPCFASNHGHEDPQAEGQAIMDFFARLRREAPEDFCLMQEYSSDRLLQYGTHALGLMWHRRWPHPEVVRYTLPEMVLFSGMCNGYSGVSHFYPGEDVTMSDALERVYLIGNRFEFPLSYEPPELANEYYRNLVSLRRACTNEMNYGDFLDTIGLGPVPERVHARIFRGPESERLAITLLDRREDSREPFEVTVDLAEIDVQRAGAVTLRTLAGETTSLTAESSEDGTISIEVPVFEDRPAALLVDVEARESG